jgi:hypothetical protein
MHIVISGSASYYCAELAELSMFLEQQGYRQLPTHSQYECERWQKARSLLVVYYNGTVLLQGADTNTPRALFTALLADVPAQAGLPF